MAGLLAGCSVGVGQGSLSALVWDPDCGLAGDTVEVDPTFFAADPVEDILEIRMQRGSDFEDSSDGISVTVRNANAMSEMLGVPYDLSITGRDALVDFSFFLNSTCRARFDRLPVNYAARSGTITFESIYAPQVGDTGVEIAATFSDVQVDDGYFTEERHATVNGDFRFLFNRGRPAQRFP